MMYLYDSPVGGLYLRSDGGFITGLLFHLPAGDGVADAGVIGAADGAGVIGAADVAGVIGAADAAGDRVIGLAVSQLDEYFAGKRRVFDLPLRPHGTAFQRLVWDALLSIPYGETMSYGQIARLVGNPKACRAVGMANNRNPISIIIPCHRVIGSNGALVGYGGGLELKTRLLELERRA